MQMNKNHIGKKEFYLNGFIKAILAPAVFILLFVSVLSLFSSFSEGALVNSVVSDSTLYNCSGGKETNLNDSIVNHSMVECSNVTNSILFYTTARNSDLFDIEANFAEIEGDMLVSGQIKYGGYTYYGPFSIDDIYSGVEPFATGSLSTNASSVRQGSSLLVTYLSSFPGYSVSLDASGIASGENSMVMRDDGTNGDVASGDGIYTAIVDADRAGTSSEILNATVDDNKGNSWTVAKIIQLDNTLPSAEIYISDANRNDNTTETDSRSVVLHLTYSDDDAVFGCKYANNLSMLSSREIEPCQKTRTWLLEALNEDKTVFYQVIDKAGNSRIVNDTIRLNMLTISSPSVVDDGDYWGFSDKLHASWYHSAGVDDSEASYRLRIYNSSAKDDTTNITNWIYTEKKDLTVTGLSLQSGITYYIGVKTYSGTISSESYSDGITIDLTPPSEIYNFSSNAPLGNWTGADTITFNFSSHDPESGIAGFSYVMSHSTSLLPDTIIETNDNPGSAVFTSLEDGIYTFRIKAKSGASTWTGIYNYTAMIDQTPPSIPILSNPEVNATGSIRFEWSASSDTVSGIELYHIQVSRNSNFTDLVVNSTTTNLYSTYSSSNKTTYYARVRAKNNAGLWSLFSDQLGKEFDYSPPRIIYITPRDYAIREDIFLRLRTDETAYCKYRNNSADSGYQDFFFTGSIMHEQKLDLDPGSYSYVIECRDSSGNSNTTTISFEVNADLDASSLQFASSEIESFEGERKTLNFTLMSGSSGLSSALPADFTVTIDDRKLPDFAIIDKGSGNYELSFIMPDIDDSQVALELEFDSLTSDPVTITSKPLYLTIIAGINDTKNQLTRITYYSTDDFSLGLATDVSDFRINGTTETLELNADAYQGYAYIFFTSPDYSDFDDVEKELDRKKFLDKINPTFGSGFGSKYTSNIILRYSGIIIAGEDYSPGGKHSFKIVNNGVTHENKINVSVSMG